MLIYQGDALERQAALPEEEQKQVSADYQGINETTGVTPGLPMGLPQNATTVRVEGGVAAGPTSCRLPSPRCTPRSHATGRRSPRCMSSWPA
jgi:hypothetical protein